MSGLTATAAHRGNAIPVVESVSVGVLAGRMGRLTHVRMRDICAALAVAVDCPTET